MTLPTLTGEFTLVDDPELRFTPSGAAVTNVRLVANKSKKNEQSGEWEQTHTLWINGSIWRQAAENVAESLVKGMSVIVTGQIYTREYETREGEKRSVVDLDIFSIGPTLKFQTAKVTKATRQQGGQSQQAASSPSAEDPWATPSSTGQQGSQQQGRPPQQSDPWGTPGVGSDEPPF